MTIEQNLEKRIFILLSVIVGFYILLRAIYFPVMTDEVSTFFMYVQTGRILPPDAAMSGNNHFLNSTLTRLSYLLFGPSIIALRLPVVLFTPLYFYFVYKTGTFIRNPVIRITFFLSMLGTHYIIEYFAFSRGYGMSLTLLSGTVLYLIRVMKLYSLKDAIKVVLLSFLALSANLNLIITSMIVLSLLVFAYVRDFMFIDKKRRYASVFVFFLYISGIGLFIFYSFKLLGQGMILGGSDSGLLDAIVVSLSDIVFGRLSLVFSLFFIFTFALSVGFYSYLFISRSLDIKDLSPGVLFLILITGNLIAALMMHHLLGVMYQDQRMAIYYLPLLFGLATFTIDDLVRKYNVNFMFILFPLWMLPFISAGQVSLESCLYDSRPYVPYSFFKEISSSVATGEYPPIVAGKHKRKSVWSYYNFLTGGKMNPVLFSDEPVLYAGYLMYNFDEREKPLQLYDEIDFDESSGLSLMKRKTEPQKSIIVVDSLEGIPLTLNKEYFKILQIPVDTVRRTALLVNFDFEIESDAIPFEGTFVCELRDSTKAIINYEAINLDQMHPAWNSVQNRIHHSLLLSPIERKPATLLIYFWNKRKVEYKIVKGRTTVYVLVL